MVTMGNCDCCGMIRSLHLAGGYVICAECNDMLSKSAAKEEEE